MRLRRFLPKLKRPKLFLLRRVAGDSMLPGLPAGTVVVGLRSRRMRKGDIVMLRHGGVDKIKRVAGTRPGGVFVVGDNASHSTDSRDFGWLDSRFILAKVVWPRGLRS